MGRLIAQHSASTAGIRPTWTSGGVLAERMRQTRGTTCTIAVVGKYVELPDAYLCVSEALRHAGFAPPVASRHPTGCHTERSTMAAPEAAWRRPRHRSSRRIRPPRHRGQGCSPSRYARHHNIPYLGLCLGMQCAVIDLAREEPERAGRQLPPSSPAFTSAPVIDLMPEQRQIASDGGHHAARRLPLQLLVPGPRRSRPTAPRGVRAASPPLRVQQRVPTRRLSRARAGLQRPLPERPPGRDHRAQGPPLVRGQTSSIPSSRAGRCDRTRSSANSCAPRSRSAASIRWSCPRSRPIWRIWTASLRHVQPTRRRVNRRGWSGISTRLRQVCA